MSIPLWLWLPFSVAALGAVLLTPLVTRLAWRIGAVARPRLDRWHHRPTAMLGGTAIYVASVTAALVTMPIWHPLERAAPVQLLGLWAAATLVFLIGLVDDLRGLSPSVKIVGQTVAACILILCGIRITSISLAWLAVPLTVFWVVGITNAVNLLDNMDGVVAGVVTIAALTMAACGAAAGQTETIAIALCLAGACCGFLIFNFQPARIFMGDCGSLYLGFTVSALALAGTMRQVSHLTAALLVPVAVLAIPIFDTTLVTVVRWLHGRPLSQGGRDHTTHRLVALGMSERGVARFLYAGSAFLSVVALAAVRLPPVAALALAGLLLLALGLFGTFLGMVQVYPAGGSGAASIPQEVRAAPDAGEGDPVGQGMANGSGAVIRPQRGAAAGRQGPRRVTVLSSQFRGKRALLRVMLDVALVPLAFAIAHLLRFDAAIPPLILQRALTLLPIWIAIKAVAMVACRTHNGLWRYAGAADVVATMKGSTLGSLALGATILITGGFNNISRSVFILDWLVFTALALVVRVGFVLLRHSFSSVPLRDAERVVVVGADESGLAAARQLRDSLTRLPVGFIDDDDAKHRCTLDGLPVLGGIEDLPRLVQQLRAQMVVIPPEAASAARAAAVCSTHGIPHVDWVGPKSH